MSFAVPAFYFVYTHFLSFFPLFLKKSINQPTSPQDLKVDSTHGVMILVIERFQHPDKMDQDAKSDKDVEDVVGAAETVKLPRPDAFGKPLRVGGGPDGEECTLENEVGNT